jgi:beta-glucosidase
VSNISTNFGPDFVWGAATASYQVEGAAKEDGRGESVWDRFCATPGKVRNGDDGSVACDFYHRYREDVALMRELGLHAFRFSIAWPRVVPEGRGRVNEKGLDFYDALVDELLANEITPFVTLFHWDTPQAIEDRGGWPMRDTVDAFVEYASIVGRRLGDRVRFWITHNEPWVHAWVGHGWGHHAPGRTSEADALATAHHLLLSHGLAVGALRQESPGSQVGITLNLDHVYPASSDPADADAARQVDGFNNRWFLDPVFRGSYPEDMLQFFGDKVPTGIEDDLPKIAVPIDFVGVNNYTRSVVRADPDGGRPIFVRNPTSDYTDMGWEVAPEGLHDLLVRLSADYEPQAIYVTENGSAYADVPGHDGRIRDTERQQFLEAYIGAVGRATSAGVPVNGYFVWSLLDNFEWAWAYWKRFGLVYVDYPTLERIPKESFHWYRELIAEQRRSAVERAAPSS